MSAGSAQDTTAEATKLLLDRWRAMSPAERMAVADRLSIDIAVFAMAGARSQAPSASETALRHEVARRRYGQALADAAYAKRRQVSVASPFDVLVRVVAMLDDLAIDYVLGGSVASSFFGEPRATADVDVAVRIDAEAGERFLTRASADFYVPHEAARRAIEAGDSFNLIDTSIPFKVDVFVLGDALLDQRQMERRIRVAVPGAEHGLWVTSPEDQVLRKLDWFRAGRGVSDQQWRDIGGILWISDGALDLDCLRTTARSVGLSDLLDDAMGSG